MRAAWPRYFAGLRRAEPLAGRGMAIEKSTRKFLEIAMLAGMNIAIENRDGVPDMGTVCGISGIAPGFSKIAVVGSGKLHEAQLGLLREALDCKNDVAYLGKGTARSYNADIYICPLPCSETKPIMNICRGRSAYIAALGKSLDEILVKSSAKEIEGINSIDMLASPSAGGFALHELRWLSRAEAESGMLIKGTDVLDMRRIGGNAGMECRLESTKCVQGYARVSGEGVQSIVDWLQGLEYL